MRFGSRRTTWCALAALMAVAAGGWSCEAPPSAVTNLEDADLGLTLSGNSAGVSFNVGSFAYKTDGSIIVPGSASFYAFTDTTEVAGRDVVLIDYFCVGKKDAFNRPVCQLTPGGKEKAGVIDGFVQFGPRVIGMLPINSVDFAYIRNFPSGSQVFLAASPDPGCRVVKWTRDTPWNGPVVGWGSRITIYPANGESYYAIVECDKGGTEGDPPGDPCIVCGASFEPGRIADPSGRRSLSRS